MQIGVLTSLFPDHDLEQTLSMLDSLDVDAVEIGAGGHPDVGHLPADQYLDDTDAQQEVQDLLDGHDMEISALATHNNPLHPDDDTAEQADQDLRDTIQLAGQMDVDTVTCFSGLPAGSPEDTTPNWITAPWPEEHADALEYQWEVATDYWNDIGDYADDHDIDIAIEMHPNMLIYNPKDLIRLRNETGERIGANFDPSHLYWQGIDAERAVRYLGEEDAINHVHAKDTEIYDANRETKGILDTAPYTDEEERSWLFRTVGYGHDEKHWKDLVSTLRMTGYDGTLSIEHEDSLTSSEEGLEKAVDVLKRSIFTTEPGETYWTE